MDKVGGKRNYGYGKQLAWAGKQALSDRYGSGHYATRAAHAERWGRFAQFAKQQGVNDARKIDQDLIERYGNTLKKDVEQQIMSVAYAQNLLSTVNVVLETLRKDRLLYISPRRSVGERSQVRSIPPFDLSRSITDRSGNDQNPVIIAARLARDFGLRFREASLLDAKAALDQAEKHGRINITQGTKGGRGKDVTRWVPVNAENKRTLKLAVVLQQNNRNLIPSEMNYYQWRNHAYYQWQQFNKQTRLKGFHALRAVYACERYQYITGHPAPVIQGQRTADKTADQHARIILAQELGHGRTDVITAYIGSAK